MNLTFDVLPMALRMITTSKVVFRQIRQIMTFDVLFDVVIFVVVINSFRRCDFNVLIFSFFDVLIPFINLFDVVIISNFFDVLFGFRRCEIRSSDLFPVGQGLGSFFWPSFIVF